MNLEYKMEWKTNKKTNETMRSYGQNKIKQETDRWTNELKWDREKRGNELKGNRVLWKRAEGWMK